MFSVLDRSRVIPATLTGDLGSLGRASNKLIRQFNFPDTYDPTRDKIRGEDHDRLLSWDLSVTRAILKEHTGTYEMGIGNWIRNATAEAALAFCVALLRADPAVQWAGFRVMGTVHRGNGFVVWTIEIFAKHPETTTKVYTGSHAPNVRSSKPKVDVFGRFHSEYDDESRESRDLLYEYDDE